MGYFKLVNSPEEFSLLRTMLKKYFPLTAQMSNMIQLLEIEAYPKEISMRLYLYVPTEEDQEPILSDPFLTCIHKPALHGHYCVTIWNPTALSIDMAMALDSLIDWGKVDTFNHLQFHLLPTVKSLVEKNGLPISHEPTSEVYYMPADVAQGIQDEEEIDGGSLLLKDMKEEDGNVLVDNWKWAGSCSRKVVPLCIRHLGSGGIFTRDQGTLVSGAVLAPLTTIHSLFTLDAFKRKGLAHLVMRHICKSASAKGLTPITDVETDNEASKGLMRKLGFIFGYEERWILLR